MNVDDRHIEVRLFREAVGEFTEQEMNDLPDAVRTFFTASISPRTPLVQSVRIAMKGHLRVGRWLPFRACEVLTPHVGFLWAARVAGILRGSDRYVDDLGQMRWKLAGLVSVAKAEGPDVSRSAAGRAAAEAVWVPTALLPRFGVAWRASDDNQIIAHYQIAGYPLELRCGLTTGGLISSVVFDRWGDADAAGRYGLHRFGGEFSAHRTFGGLTIPSEGRLGWHYGTDRWSRGEFFRYQITDMEPFLPSLGSAPPDRDAASQREEAS